MSYWEEVVKVFVKVKDILYIHNSCCINCSRDDVLE